MPFESTLNIATLHCPFLVEILLTIRPIDLQSELNFPSAMCLAIPGKVVTITQEQELAREGMVDFEGIRKSINLSLVPEATVNDYVLVHVGFAISRIDATEAERVFDTLRQMDELDEIGPNELPPSSP